MRLTKNVTNYKNNLRMSLISKKYKYFSEYEELAENIVADIKENQKDFMKIVSFLEEKAEEEMEIQKNNSRIYASVKKDLESGDYIKKMYEMINKGGFDDYIKEIDKERKNTFWKSLKDLGKKFLKGLAFENAVKYGIKNALMFIVPGVGTALAPAITGIGLAIAAYHLYKDVKIAKEMKDNLLSEMSDSLKEKLRNLFETIQKTIQVCKLEKNNSKRLVFNFYSFEIKFFNKCNVDEEKIKNVHIILNTYVEKGLKDAEDFAQKINKEGEYDQLIKAVKELDKEIKK